jgi:hypothetical protein
METKHSNWFAGGPEVQRALLLLADGALRLYLHICLSASRKSGQISLSYQDLAQTLGRSRRSIASHFDELRRLGICHMQPAVNQHRCTEIEVCDDFWPYKNASRHPAFGARTVSCSNQEASIETSLRSIHVHSSRREICWESTG